MLSKGFPKNYPESVIALGFFDGVHLGHQAVLNQAATIATKKRNHYELLHFIPIHEILLGIAIP